MVASLGGGAVVVAFVFMLCVSPFEGAFALLAVSATVALVLSSRHRWILLPPVRRVRGPLSIASADVMAPDEFGEWVAEIFARAGSRGLAVSSARLQVTVEGWNAVGAPLYAWIHRAAPDQAIPAATVQTFVTATANQPTGTMRLIVTNAGFTPDAISIGKTAGVLLVDRQALMTWTTSGTVLR